MKKILQTFKDFLTGVPTQDIKEKCQPFIKESGGKPLFRGYGIGNSKSKEVAVRKDRKSRDTDFLIHTLMDEYFDEKFGLKARTQGMFTIGDKNQASVYGMPHYVLPVGEFKYIWGLDGAKPISDTLVLSERIKSAILGEEEKAKDIAKQILDQVVWKRTDLQEAMRMKAEIIIFCESVIIVPVSKIEYQDLIK